MPEQLIRGKKYRIARDGGMLSHTVPVGGGAYSGVECALSIGAIVTYDGKSNGWGCDPIPVPKFTADGAEAWDCGTASDRDDGALLGTFWPNDFGHMDLDFFEPVGGEEVDNA
jgi:hypothetical protein